MEPEPDPVVLQRIQKNSYAHEEVVKLFTDRWDRRKSQCPEIVMAYSITNNKLKSRYDDYKKQLKADGKNPNEGINFHGTVLSCDILNNGVECDNSRCSICGIAKEGFNEEKIGYNIPRFQRFGSGIYLAPIYIILQNVMTILRDGAVLERCLFVRWLLEIITL